MPVVVLAQSQRIDEYIACYCAQANGVVNVFCLSFLGVCGCHIHTFCHIQTNACTEERVCPPAQRELHRGAPRVFSLAWKHRIVGVAIPIVEEETVSSRWRSILPRQVLYGVDETIEMVLRTKSKHVWHCTGGSVNLVRVVMAAWHPINGVAVEQREVGENTVWNHSANVCSDICFLSVFA